jgi:Ca-activated chloride channel family protein
MRKGFRLASVVAAMLVVGLSVVAQDNLRVDVRLVNVVATVTDTNGRYVRNLRATDFAIDEDGRRQDIVHFNQDYDIPVSFGIALDTSQSMNRRIRVATDAVKRFSRVVHPDDDIFLMTFSNDPAIWQDFTNDRQKLSRALNAVWTSGGTALHDALSEALLKIRQGRHDKRAILLITDGLDTSSSTTADQVIREVRRSEVLVYSLAIAAQPRNNGTSPFAYGFPNSRQRRNNPRDSVNMSLLRQFAESSGGRAMLISESGGSTDLNRALGQIADELRNQYTLGYYPSTPDDGRFHSIRVRTRNGYSVRARNGYYARPD